MVPSPLRSSRVARSLSHTAVAALLLLAAAPTAHAYPEGFYINLGFGGAQVEGDRGIAMGGRDACSNQQTLTPFLWREPEKNNLCRYAPSVAAFEEISRTDFGSGLAFNLAFGYNILGHVSLEASIFGHGNTAATDGAGYANFQVRWHFLKLLETFEVVTPAERKYDADVFVGVGYTIGGYRASDASLPAGVTGDNDKGWEGYNISFGLGFHYEVHSAVSLGVDLKFAYRQFVEWIANFDDGYRSEPEDGPTGGIAIIPTFSMRFHTQ